MRGLLRRLTPEPIRRMVRRIRGANGAPQSGGMFAVYQPPGREVFERCNQVYGDAFRTAFEYLVGNTIRGDVVEFGTYRGYSARVIAALIREFRGPGGLWLYDSFAGLPAIEAEIDKQSYEVAVNKVWYSGQMAVEEGLVRHLQRDLARIIPQSQYRLVPGNFADTLPAQLPGHPVALAHLDCGLYASTHLVLSMLLERDLLQDGALLLFSDFNSNRASPRMGDRKALQDAFAAQQRFDHQPFFRYGWNGQAFFVHERASAEILQEQARTARVDVPR